MRIEYILNFVAMEEAEPIVLKTDRLDGVDMSVSDISMLSAVKVVVTNCTEPIFKIKTQSFIGTKERLDDGDVIQVGDLGIKYRVIKNLRMRGKTGNIYRIKRVDGFAITSLDINATRKGQRVKIVNRKSYKQIFEEISKA